MRQRNVSPVRGVARGSSMVEGLEDRRMMSASVVQLSAVKPGKVLAGTTAYETVTVHNFTADAVTEDVAVTLVPSLDGSTAAGAYPTPTTTESVTIKKHGTARLKVPFVPQATMVAGKYHTLATVTVGADAAVAVAAVTAEAPGTYTLTLPPGPTTNPSLVGHYSGLIYSSTSTSTGLFGTGTNTRVKEATFIWETTAQDLSTLTGLFAVGSGQTTATMTGEELTTGVVTYTLTSDDINYTLKGKVSADGRSSRGPSSRRSSTTSSPPSTAPSS